MNLIVNKKAITIPHNSTVIDVLEYLNYSKAVAVFINGKQLLFSQYNNYPLQENDNVRVIKPLGGG